MIQNKQLLETKKNKLSFIQTQETSRTLNETQHHDLSQKTYETII